MKSTKLKERELLVAQIYISVSSGERALSIYGVALERETRYKMEKHTNK
jgi:hypothetical protein